MVLEDKDNLIEHLRNVLLQNREKIKDSICDKFKSSEFYLDIPNGDYEDIEIFSIELGEESIVEISNTTATVTLNSTIGFDAYISYDDVLNACDYTDDAIEPIIRYKNNQLVRDEISLPIELNLRFSMTDISLEIINLSINDDENICLPVKNLIENF